MRKKTKGKSVSEESQRALATSVSELMADSAYELAERILEFDERNPGETESVIEVPFSVWADWIDLAGKAGFVRRP